MSIVIGHWKQVDMNTPQKNDQRFSYDIFKFILVYGLCGNFFQISLEFVIDNISPLVQVMAWYRIDEKL